MRYVALALLLAACGGSSPSAPLNGVTPATLVGAYDLKSYDGQSTPAKTYGVASGTLTLKPDSTYTIALTALPAGTTPAGWAWTYGSGRWSYMGHYFDEEIVFLQPSFVNAPTWNGAIRKGGLSFSGNGYPDVLFLPRPQPTQ